VACAGFAERLPAGRYHLAQSFGAAEATQIALGFAYGGYRFERYRAAGRSARPRSILPPTRTWSSSLGKRGADPGARPDQYTGL